jgi:cobalt/nickel transport system permease protein
MHIPDGFTSLPINAAAAVVSAACCGVGVIRARRTLDEKQVPLLGLTGSFIFAAQMLNFPVAAGTSGHFLGATLAAVLLGPFEACLVLAVVLITQCLAFQDGGLLALGPNVLNMGVVGGVLGYFVFVGLRGALPRSRSGFLAATAVASWLSVILGAAACSLELAFSDTVPLAESLAAMLGVHAIIGLGEALITSTVVGVVLGARPDLVGAWRPLEARS